MVKKDLEVNSHFKAFKRHIYLLLAFWVLHDDAVAPKLFLGGVHMFLLCLCGLSAVTLVSSTRSNDTQADCRL